MAEYNLLLRSASQLQSDTHFVLGKEVDMLREDTVGEEILEVVIIGIKQSINPWDWVEAIVG